MDAKRLAVLADDLTQSYDVDVIAHDVGQEIKAMIVADDSARFDFSRTADGRIVYSANHETFNVIEVTFPAGYFSKATPPSFVGVTLDIADNSIEAHLKSFGFIREWTGGNCSAYIRSDGEIREYITLAYSPEVPTSMTDKVDVGTYDADDQPLADIVSGYTLADVVAALENPSDEYALLSLRLYNGLHS